MYQGRFSKGPGKEHDFNLAQEGQNTTSQQPGTKAPKDNTAGPVEVSKKKTQPRRADAAQNPDKIRNKSVQTQTARPAAPKRTPRENSQADAAKQAALSQWSLAPRDEAERKKRIPQDEALRFNPVFDSNQPVLIQQTEHQPYDPDEPQPVKRKRKRVSVILGGILFYLILAIVVAGTVMMTKTHLTEVQEELAVYEKVQPTHISDGIFNQYFTTPDWPDLYQRCGVTLSPFDGVEQFTQHMEARMEGKKLSYRKLSQQDDNFISYGVYAGFDKLAGFTITNESEDPAAPEWKLDQLQVFFEPNETFQISHRMDQVVKINGIPLENEALLVKEGTRVTEDFMKRSSALDFPGNCIGEISGLLVKPVVTVEDGSGNLLEVTYDEESRTFFAPASEPVIPAEAEELALEAVRTYCRFMIKKAYLKDLAVYFAPNTDTYNMIRSADLVWIQKEQDHGFADEKVSDYVRFDEDTFGIRVSLTWQLTRPDGTIKESPVDQTLIFKREPSDKWRCIRMSGYELLEHYRNVRVQFIQGGNVISSIMVNSIVDTDTVSLVCPKLEVPADKKFVGWAIRTKDMYGVEYYQRVLDVTGPGSVEVSPDFLDTPVDLYPLYEVSEDLQPVSQIAK